jgi:uncharacterized membrane protein
MTDAFAPPPRRNILLIVSLCLNAALIAIVAIGLWRAAHPFASQRGILSPYGLMREVPAKRDQVQTILNSHTAELRALRVASGEARLRAVESLDAPDYSPERFAAALQAVGTADAALEAKLIDTMNESFAILSPEERKTVAATVRRRNRAWMFQAFGTRAP